MPLSDTVQGATAYLAAFNQTFKTHYVPGIVDKIKRHGRTTRFIELSKRPLDGMRMEFELKRFPNRGVTATKDLMATMPAHRPGLFTRFQLRFDHTDPNANDFMMLQAGVITTLWDIEKKMDSMWKGDVNFIEKDIQEIIDDFSEAMARHVHLPTDGKLATIAGIKNDNVFTYSSATSYTTGNTTAAIQVDATSMAKLAEGQFIEIRSAAGALRRNNIRITSCQPHQKVIHVQATSDTVDGGGAAALNFNSVAATDVVYISGSYNVGVPGSLNGFFDETVPYFRDTSGNAITRTGAQNPTYKQLMPYRIATAAANTDLTESHLRSVGELLAHKEGDGNAVVRRLAIMARDGYNQMVKLGKDSATRLIPALESQVGQQLNLAFGFDGYVFHDPNIGPIAAVVDDFAEYGKIRFLDREDWEIAIPSAGTGTVRWAPGPIAGQWFQMPATDGTPTLKYAARAFMPFALVCTWPTNQVEISGLNINA